LEKEREGIPFFPNHFLKEVIAAFILLALLISLAVFVPAGIEPKADPFDTPAHIKPEWYFMGMYQVLKVTPNELLGIFLSSIFIGLLFLVPFIDRNPERKLAKRKFGLAVFFGLIALLIIFTLWGKYS
jgi:quinol-cytochrome oxidoreductase complex cytochrome b subunit